MHIYVHERAISCIYAVLQRAHNHQAASWEFFDSGNTVAARVLLQRALRLNPAVANLWTQYFRLEWCYVQKIVGRREILGLNDINVKNDTDKNNSDTTLDIPKVTSEGLHTRNKVCLVITMLLNGSSIQHIYSKNKSFVFHRLQAGNQQSLIHCRCKCFALSCITLFF
jgi:hypothetical protein